MKLDIYNRTKGPYLFDSNHWLFESINDSLHSGITKIDYNLIMLFRR